MKLEEDLAGHSPDRESVLTIGVFDGVHRGHQHVISRVKAETERTGRLAGVVTFRNPPASVFEPDFKPQYLASLDDRLGLIHGRGVDYVVPVSFDLGLSKLRAGEFAALLQKHLRMVALVVGPDFAMGYRREGDPGTLASLGREMGFSVHVVDPIADDQGQPIRSTAVREALARGDVARVAVLLGRNFVLGGTVVTGAGRGAGLGFPTANLKIAKELALTGDGIYATWAHVGPRRYMAATSIGMRPIFEKGERTVETFILDFDGDLYGQEVRLEFVRRLRDEVQFDSVSALQEQVDKDVDEAKAVLQGS